MTENKHDQSRISLAIAFIATYITLIFNLIPKIGDPQIKLSVPGDLFFGIFIIWGIVNSCLFFLYLCFTALNFSFDKKKSIFFDQKISIGQLDNLRKSFFNLGVKGIFVSFTFPVYYFYSILYVAYGSIIGLILWSFCLGLIYILLHFIFSKK